MLDLNNMTLNSLLAMNSIPNTQDSTESEQLCGVSDDLLQDDGTTIDPSTFVLLFAQITSNNSAPEKNAPVEAEVINLVEAQPAPVVPEGQAINALEDNVAVAWINSDYYQSELTADLAQTTNANEPLGEEISALIEKAVAAQKPVLNSDKEQMTPKLASQATPESKEGESVHAKINSPIAVPEENVMIQATELAEINSSDTANNNPKYNAQQTANTVSSKLNEAPSQLPAADLTSEKELAVDEESSFDLAETSLVEESGERLMPETRTPLVETVKQEGAQPIMNNAIQLNQVSNGPLQRSQENDNLLMPQTFHIPTDIDHPEWSNHFSQQVMWLGQQGIKSAVIQIHPEDLGPIEISIKVVNNSASVNIVSLNPHTRDIIEQALPKLQDMMAEQGLSLADVQIDSEKGARQFAQREDRDSQEQYVQDFEEEILVTPLRHKVVSKGLVDYFA